jgi:hypothetical protein
MKRQTFTKIDRSDTLKYNSPVETHRLLFLDGITVKRTVALASRDCGMGVMYTALAGNLSRKEADMLHVIFIWRPLQHRRFHFCDLGIHKGKQKREVSRLLQQTTHSVRGI